jgi:hypothetical protein
MRRKQRCYYFCPLFICSLAIITCKITPPVPIQSDFYENIYYVDRIRGNDTYDGRSMKYPWKTLEAVNKTVFSAGDAILFRRGGEWRGNVTLKGSGTRNKSIYVGAYGRGDDPALIGDGHKAAITIEDEDCWIINDLAIRNDGSGTKSVYGILMRALERNVSCIRIVNCRISHVGDEAADFNDFESAGIGLLAESKYVKSKFSDIVISGNLIEHIEGTGILLGSLWNRWYGEEYSYPSENVRISENNIYDTAFDGIELMSLHDGVVEANVIRGCCRSSYSFFSAGITVFDNTETVISSNTITGIEERRSPAIRIDYFNLNIHVERNYSYANTGGFCSLEGGDESREFNHGIVIRYNIAAGEGNNIFRFLGSVSAALVHNNTVYISSMDTPLITNNAEAAFINNLIIQTGKNRTELDSSANNWFWNGSVYSDRNPLLQGSVERLNKNRSSASVFMLSENSPLIDKGVNPVTSTKVKDFAGNQVPSGDGYDLGAFEYKETE